MLDGGESDATQGFNLISRARQGNKIKNNYFLNTERNIKIHIRLKYQGDLLQITTEDKPCVSFCFEIDLP